MDDGFKLSFVSNVEERIEIVLNSLNNGTNIQDTNATEVLKLFEPDAIAYEEYFKNNPNSKYTFKEFAIFYAIDKGNYINYFCHTYLALIPKGFETFLEGLDFYSFADDADYEKFVSMNVQKYYEQISEKKNVQRFVENMAAKGKILLLFHSTYIHHQRTDGKYITRNIVNPVPVLGEFYQNTTGFYKFRVINPDLEDEIIILADDKIELKNREVKFNLERRKKRVR